MKHDSPLWRVLGAAAQEHEQAALDRIRDLLPDDGIARAWANVTFTDLKGGLNEVDLLLVAKTGVFVVELKGWHGSIVGDQSYWVHNGKSMPNPVIATRLKAQKLASLLQHALKGKGRTPFISPAVVLHGASSTVELNEYARDHVWHLDGYGVKGLGGETVFKRMLETASHQPLHAADVKQFDAVMGAVGLKPRPKTRTVGDYVLESGDPLGEGEGWQDFKVVNPKTKVLRRIRVFQVPANAPKLVREETERRAVRESRLTNAIEHAGIVGPLDFIDADAGPALVFDYRDEELSLDEYLASRDREQPLTFDERVYLLREIVELVQYAHSRRLVHRALTPASVRIDTRAGAASRVRIRDWDAGRRVESETQSQTAVSAGATKVAVMVEQRWWQYLAPETIRDIVSSSPEALDVYGLGMIAYRLLAGTEPPDLKDVQARVQRDEGLDPRAVRAELHDAFAALVVEATMPRDMDRTIDVSAMLAQLDAAMDAITSDAEPEPVALEADPLDAQPKEIIGGERFSVTQRRGQGSTGVALLVDDFVLEVEDAILKIARDEGAIARLHDEAEVLRQLEHPRIVKVIDGPFVLDGTQQRHAILLSDAGAETLSERIRSLGPGTLEELQRFGADLFDAIEHLDARGVFHRDVKPSNLAIAADPGSRKPRLTLFDLSLAREPLETLTSGSRPYLDPYLGTRGRYDSAAERFAVAATLFELASGQPVGWDAGDAPLADEPPIVAAVQFREPIGERLATFFRSALAPAVADRHGSLTEMREAWESAVAGETEAEVDAEALDAQAASASASTPLVDAGLSARAQTAASRLGADTVGDLMAVPAFRLNSSRGVGHHVRRELQARAQQWRAAATEATPTADVEEGKVVGRQPAEALLERLLPGDERERALLRRNLGLDRGAKDPWPTRKELAQSFGIDLARVHEVVGAAAARWAKQATIGPLFTQVLERLDALDGIATLDELATAVLFTQGSNAPEDERRRIGAALVRAVLEVDDAAVDPRLRWAHAGGDRRRIVVGVDRDGEQSLLDHVDAMQAALRDALAGQGIAAPSTIRERLRAIAPQSRVLDARRVAIAVAVTDGAALSSIGEVHRLDLDPIDAVARALRGFAAPELTVESIQRRAQLRFPSLTIDLERPTLDRAVDRALPRMAWIDDRYVLREEAASSTMSSTSMVPRADAGTQHRALQQSLEARSPLVLRVSWKQREHIVASLAHGYGVEVVDVAAVVLEALRTGAAENGIAWTTVLAADAATAGERDAANLARLASLTARPSLETVLQSSEPQLLTRVGVLARLGLGGVLSDVLDLAAKRPAARWVAVPDFHAGYGGDEARLPLGGAPTVNVSGEAAMTTRMNA